MREFLWGRALVGIHHQDDLGVIMEDKVTPLGIEYLGRTTEHNDFGRRALAFAMIGVLLVCVALLTWVFFDGGTGATFRILLLSFLGSVVMAKYAYITGMRGYVASQRNLATNGRLFLVAVVTGPVAAVAVFLMMMAVRLQWAS